ncbi:MAG: P-loop NTPase [Candidatus Nanohaloarchaea archaeon]
MSGRVIGMISGKGGVGKTSLTVNLGVSLSDFGKEVTIVDTDFSGSNLGVHLGRYDHPVKIQDVLENDEHPSNAVFRHPTGIKAMVASNELHHLEPDLDRLEDAVEHAKRNSDYVLVDCPPGMNSTVEEVMKACEELMVISTPTQTSGINAAQIIERAKQLRIPILGTVVNMSEEDPEMELVESEVEMMTESHIMATVPYDRQMKKSVFEKEPLISHSPISEASLEIQELAASLEGEKFERPRFANFKRKINRLRENISR